MFQLRELLEPRQSIVRRAVRNDFVRHGLLVFGGTTAVNFLNYIFNVVISRRIGVDAFATLSALVSLFMILSVPANVLNTVIIKYAAAYHTAKDSVQLGRLAERIIRWSLWGAAALLAAGLLCSVAIADALRINDVVAVTLTIVILAVGFVSPCLRGILQGEQRFRNYVVSVLSETLLKVCCAVALVYAGAGVAGAMGGWCLGSLVSLIYTIAVVRREPVQSAVTSQAPVDRGTVVKTSMNVAGTIGLVTVMSFMDVLLVKHYFASHEAGIYAAVNLTGKVVLFFVGFLPAIIVPKAAARAAAGGSPLRLLLQAGLLTGVLCGGILAIFALRPEAVLTALAGRQFVAGAQYVVAYDFSMALLAGVTLLANYSMGVHRFGFMRLLALIVAAEVVAIASWHGSLWDVIHIMIAANAAACLVLAYGLVRQPSDSSTALRMAA